eukprot:NODE_30451_length_418_cov_0.831615.p2 GENE.NODE_30451_length_418_cov_0.831615~~NODE_30451_length_418_cov_0.831615.p2  ORF type:complete len:55 (-),score=15.60 NODE_30451_length_418_cov_0.831615:83-247(-)
MGSRRYTVVAGELVAKKKKKKKKKNWGWFRCLKQYKKTEQKTVINNVYETSLKF